LPACPQAAIQAVKSRGNQFQLDGVHEITIFSESELAPIGQAIPGSAVPSTVDLLWLAMSG